jgi:adenylate cyclase
VVLTCASCGAENPAGARFCSDCGAPLHETCPGCGAEQPATAAFCSSCGIALRPHARRASEVADERQERRVVTVLFADLAGSTALGELLDPEDVRELQGELFDLINTEVERFGGTTEKFAGDAVLAVFGIPQAHEDDPERAVRAALAVRDGFDAFTERVQGRHGAEVGLRIGINTGEVVASREAAARGELSMAGIVTCQRRNEKSKL